MGIQSSLDEHIYREIKDFLLFEAELLDDRRFREWLELLTEDMQYNVPIRVTKEKKEGSEFLPETAWLRDTPKSLEVRVRRLEARYPVAEDPPSRTRHFISNVRVHPSDGKDRVEVKSNLLVYRTRGEIARCDVFSAARRDVLRRLDGRWRLARRDVLLDQAVIDSGDISIIL